MLWLFLFMLWRELLLLWDIIINEYYASWVAPNSLLYLTYIYLVGHVCLDLVVVLRWCDLTCKVLAKLSSLSRNLAYTISICFRGCLCFTQPFPKSQFSYVKLVLESCWLEVSYEKKFYTFKIYSYQSETLLWLGLCELKSTCDDWWPTICTIINWPSLWVRLVFAFPC